MNSDMQMDYLNQLMDLKMSLADEYRKFIKENGIREDDKIVFTADDFCNAVNVGIKGKCVSKICLYDNGDIKFIYKTYYGALTTIDECDYYYMLSTDELVNFYLNIIA